MRRFSVLILVQMLLVALVGCGQSAGSHFEKAKNLEHRLLTRGTEVTYADPGYLAVARELEKVPPWSSDYKSARDTLSKIKDARRIKLNEQKDLGYLPSRLKGVTLASLAPPQTLAQRAAKAALEQSRASEKATSQGTSGASPPASGTEQSSSDGATATSGTTTGSVNGADKTSEAVRAVASQGTHTSTGASGHDVIISKATNNTHRSASGAEPSAEKSKSFSGDKNANGQKPVILYMASWCGYCRKANAYLRQKGVPIIEKNIERDREAQQEMMRKTHGYSGIPVIDIDGTIIRGFDVPGIDAALARRAR